MKYPELSYARTDDSFLKRLGIQTLEILTGRNYFVPLYEFWREEIVPSNGPVIEPMLDLVGVHLDVVEGALPQLAPTDPPIIIVANHPYGIMDGIAALALAERLGRPFKVLINKDLLKVPEIRPYSLPVDFSETREAQAANIAMRNEALKLLGEGYTIVVFPAGGVATARKPFGIAEELPWKNFTARMIQSSGANVLPIFFEGQNGPLFHAGSRISMTLRLGLLISEFRRLVGSTLRVRIGDIIPYAELAPERDRRKLMQLLYERVMGLGRD